MDGLMLSIDKSMLEPNNVIQFVDVNLTFLIDSITADNKNEIKNKINLLAEAIFTNNYELRLEYTLHLRFSDALIQYAQAFNSIETIDNVLKNLNDDKIKSYCANKFNYQFKYLIAFAYFVRFNAGIRSEEERRFSKDELKDIIISKYHLTKLFINHIGNKNELTEQQYNNVIVMLSGILSQLSRWPECLSMLNRILKDDSKSDTQVKYIRAITLSDVKDKTCLNYNGMMLLKILDDCNDVINTSNNKNDFITKKIINLKKEILKQIDKYNLKIEQLKEHQEKDYWSGKNISQAEKYFKEHDMFLNEHSFVCNCTATINDDLELSTKHTHTQIDWVNEKVEIFEDLKARFSLSRIELFKSQKNISLSGLNSASLSKTVNSRLHLKSVLIKSAFKRCYSILDTIGISLLNHENKDYEGLKDSYGNRISIYFLNLWDYNLFTDQEFRHNNFLHSLYSISKDLDRTKYSALKEFKAIRNSIEHKVLLVGDYEKECIINGRHYVPFSKMNNYTMILMRLTRSAIFSYVYYIRSRSKSKSKSN